MSVPRSDPEFIAVRLWERGRDGRYWPVKGRGVSVRMREARGVADALVEALELAEGQGQGQGRPAVEAPPRPPRPEAPALEDDEPF